MDKYHADHGRESSALSVLGERGRRAVPVWSAFEDAKRGRFAHGTMQRVCKNLGFAVNYDSFAEVMKAVTRLSKVRSQGDLDYHVNPGYAPPSRTMF
jgi:hypothetical protein